MRIFLLLVGGYILFKLVRSILIPGSTDQKIGSQNRHKRSEYKNLSISDAEFEDIDERKKWMSGPVFLAQQTLSSMVESYY